MKLDLDHLNGDFERLSPQEILAWAWETFRPGIAATSSFQTQSLPLLHMIAQTTPELPILFLNTGFHFSETLEYRDKLAQDLGLNIEIVKPELENPGFLQRYGELYHTNPDYCCRLNKVEPLRRALSRRKAWISGIRRDQTAARNRIKVVELQSNGLYKIAPLANWTSREVWQYIHDHNLPEHPLLSQGYMSIGCSPCTRPVGPGEDERAGRWSGQGKTECGLHLPQTWDEGSKK